MGTACDDAFITYRYAKHLGMGLGLCWNPGEPPIEGFTSLGYALTLGLAYRLGIDPLVLSQICGLAGAALLCVGAARLAAELLPSRAFAPALASLCVAAASPVALWSRGGLETTVFAGVFACGVASWSRSASTKRTIAWPVLLATAILLRPEALGVAVVLGLVDVLFLARSDAAERDPRPFRGWIALAAFAITLLGWRAWYFGDWLPNSFRAKSGGGWPAVLAGSKYCYELVAWAGPFALIAVAGCLLVRDRLPRRAVVGCCGAAIPFLVATIRVGGDYQAHFRYLVPLIPLLAAFVAVGIAVLLDAGIRRPSLRWAALALTAAVPAWWARPSLLEVKHHPALLTRPWALVEDLSVLRDPRFPLFREDFEPVGRALHDIVKSGEVVGSIAVGRIGYYSDARMIDLLGLNDREIAAAAILPRSDGRWLPGHMRGSARIVMERKPEFLLLASRAADEPGESSLESVRRAYAFVDELVTMPQFREAYVPTSCPLPDGRWMNFYQRADLREQRCAR